MTTEPFTLPEQPESIEYHWTWWSNDGPVTTDGSGVPIQIDRLTITEYPDGEVTVSARGNFLTKAGKPDKRYANGTAYASLDWKDDVRSQWVVRRALQRATPPVAGPVACENTWQPESCTCMVEDDGSIETPSGSCPVHGWAVEGG